MSTSTIENSEADVDICNAQKKNWNGCRHPQVKTLKWMSTSAMHQNKWSRC